MYVHEFMCQFGRMERVHSCYGMLRGFFCIDDVFSSVVYSHPLGLFCVQFAGGVAVYEIGIQRLLLANFECFVEACHHECGCIGIGSGAVVGYDC